MLLLLSCAIAICSVDYETCMAKKATYSMQNNGSTKCFIWKWKYGIRKCIWLLLLIYHSEAEDKMSKNEFQNWFNQNVAKRKTIEGGHVYAHDLMQDQLTVRWYSCLIPSSENGPWQLKPVLAQPGGPPEPTSKNQNLYQMYKFDAHRHWPKRHRMLKQHITWIRIWHIRFVRISLF